MMSGPDREVGGRSWTVLEAVAERVVEFARQVEGFLDGCRRLTSAEIQRLHGRRGRPSKKLNLLLQICRKSDGGKYYIIPICDNRMRGLVNWLKTTDYLIYQALCLKGNVVRNVVDKLQTIMGLDKIYTGDMVLSDSRSSRRAESTPPVLRLQAVYVDKKAFKCLKYMISSECLLSCDDET